MKQLAFSPLEKSISFYTRNDFAILNNLLIENYDTLWEYAMLAYNDNRGIIDEYENGTRTVDSDYDIKWLSCLRERLIDTLDGKAKQKIIETARVDISNILGAMAPAKEPLMLFRTAWTGRDCGAGNTYTYSREYTGLKFAEGSILEIETISSCSLTPYREDDDVGSDFYRYEIHVPEGNRILPLDPFACHNEDGEVLLPPMRCRVTAIRKGGNSRCKSIISLEYLEQLAGGQ